LNKIIRQLWDKRYYNYLIISANAAFSAFKVTVTSTDSTMSTINTGECSIFESLSRDLVLVLIALSKGPEKSDERSKDRRRILHEMILMI
jgi:hypothetical protein